MVPEATIGGEGTIQDLKVVASEATLAKLAAFSIVEAVKQWIYQPTFRRDKAVEVVSPITFELDL